MTTTYRPLLPTASAFRALCMASCDCGPLSPESYGYSMQVYGDVAASIAAQGFTRITPHQWLKNDGSMFVVTAEPNTLQFHEAAELATLRILAKGLQHVCTFGTVEGNTSPDSLRALGTALRDVLSAMASGQESREPK